MNAMLRELLLAAGLERDYVRSLRWSDVLIVDSLGNVPASAQVTADYVRHRGFNFILLNVSGKPAYFGKCRSATDDEVAHETAVLEVLSRDHELRDVLPETRGWCSASIRIQISRYIGAESFRTLVPKMAAEDWGASMQQILLITSRIAARAEACLPELFTSAPSLDFLEAARPALKRLREVGVSPDHVAALARCLGAAGRAPRALQHGDLWPGNIITDRRSWWLVDFAWYGREALPMFDAYHLVRECSELRGDRVGATPGSVWLALMETDTTLAATARHTLRWALGRCGLHPVQGVGALAAYFSLLAGRLIARRSPYWVPFAREAEYLATQLQQGAPVTSRLFGES